MFLFLTITAAATQATAVPREYKPVTNVRFPETDADSTHAWNALHYELQLQITPISVPNDLTIEGQVELTFTPEISGLDTVDLHLHGLSVDAVQLDGTDCDFYREEDKLYAVLPQAYNPGDTLHLQIAYHGTPEITNLITPTGIFYSGENMIYTMNDPFGARNWIPCWDEPWDKATVRQILTLPDNFVVVANGTFEGSVAAPPWKTWTYFMDQPITTYLISFCASDYATFEQTAGSVQIKHYVYPQHLSMAQYDFERVPEMIEAFSGYYGSYPFATYGYAEAPMFGGGGAMENQTIVTFGDLLITGNRTYEDIVAHELAHQWFGDAVSYLDWPEMWLSEGFATYSEALWHQHLEGITGYHQYMSTIQAGYYGWENPNNPIPIYDPPWDQIWTPLTYEKAASVLHALRYHLGDDDFFETLQTYFATFAYTNASTRDLNDIVNQVSGENYDWFFDQWIYDAGFPVFEYLATWEPSGADYDIHLTVAQVQNDLMPRFRTDADLYIFSGGDTTIQRLTIAPEYTQQIELTVTDPPDSLQLDPLNWILGYKYRRDDLTEPVLSAQDPVIADQSGDGFLSPGESGDLSFIITNSGLPAPASTVSLTSHDPLLTVLEDTRSIPAIPFNGQYDLATDPFPVENAPASSPRWVDFTVQVNDSATGEPITTLEIALPVGDPELLLVDDDGGGDAEIKHQEALNAIRRVYQTVEYTSAGDLPSLTDYFGVIWACGAEAENTLTEEDQTLLEDYLIADNGALMLSGRGIVPDLAGTNFFDNVLHARDAGTTVVVVLQGVDPLVEGMTFSISGDGAEQDIIETDGNPDADDFLTYLGVGSPGAIKYDGNYKSAVFGFGFEDVQGGSPVFNPPEDLLGPLIAWFTGTPGTDDEQSPGSPNVFAVTGVYPNPFNPTAIIRFDLPQAARVSLDVYDLNGRRVYTENRHTAPLQVTRYSPGTHEIVFNGSGLASGVYFYRLTFDPVRNTGKTLASSVGKMLLLK